MKIIPYQHVFTDRDHTNVDEAFMEYFAPQAPHDSAPAPAIVICPGGGYRFLSVEKEGYVPARFFAGNGVHAFVLWYRHKEHQHPAPLRDAQQAVRQLRSEHETWNLDPERIGCLGFSAGGHLVSTLGTHFDDEFPGAPCAYRGVSARPDFMILMYPVISMLSDKHSHAGSRQTLIGASAPKELQLALSSHKQVSAATPPTLLEHGKIDSAVPVENSMLFCDALKAFGVPTKLYIEDGREHGYGFIDQTQQRCLDWLEELGVVSVRQAR